MDEESYEFIREMDDYEIRDFILNIFNAGRMSMIAEKQEIEYIDFDPEEFLADYASQRYWN